MKINALCLCSLILMANESLHAAEFESMKGQAQSETIQSAATSADILVSALTME